MLSVALQWRRAQWLRKNPGKLGLLLLGTLPLAFLTPLQHVPLFPNWIQGASAILWLGTITLTAILVKDSGVVGRDAIWPYQKSIALVDWHLCNWLIDGSAAAILLLWWACWLAVGQNIYIGWEARSFAAMLIAAGLLLLLVHSFLFLLGSSGTRRGIDIFMISTFFGAIRDVILDPLPVVIAVPLRAMLPPIGDVFAASSLLVRGEPSAIKPLLVVLTYSFVCCTGAILLLKRAKPPV